MGIQGAPEDNGGVPAVAEEELERRRLELEDLIEMMRPSVQMDGGDIQLTEADYTTGVIAVELQGACGSCAIAELSTISGVSQLVKDRLDWVTEVKGGVDEDVDPLESAAQGRGAYVPRYY